MKMNTFQMEQQEEQFSQNLSYEEWLRNNVSPLNNSDLQAMEKNIKPTSAFIIKQPTIFPHPINTFYYQPLQPQGA